MCTILVRVGEKVGTRVSLSAVNFFSEPFSSVTRYLFVVLPIHFGKCNFIIYEILELENASTASH